MGVDIQTYRAKIGTFRHSFGADVVTILLVVNFSHGIKTVGSVLFIGLLLIMAGIEQNPGPIESGNIESTKIKVTGIPKSATAEILTSFFEDVTRQGGCKVKNVAVDFGGNSAIVEFENAAAVDRVMKQQPVQILKTEVNIEVYEPSPPEMNTDISKWKRLKEVVAGAVKGAKETFVRAVRTVPEQSQVDTIPEDKGDDSSFSRQLMPELEGLVSQESTHTTRALSGSLETSLRSARVPKPEELSSSEMPGCLSRYYDESLMNKNVCLEQRAITISSCMSVLCVREYFCTHTSYETTEISIRSSEQFQNYVYI